MFAVAFPLALAWQATPAGPPPSQPILPPACESGAYDEFDFWVGSWEVYPSGSEAKVADSLIERKHRGCAIVETWMPTNGFGGTSLTHVDLATGIWHQKWVGAAPGAVDFTGGWTGSSMVLTGIWPAPTAAHQIVRMTYTPLPDGSVRQFGENSTDHGLSWQTAFDLIYRRKEAAE